MLSRKQVNIPFLIITVISAMLLSAGIVFAAAYIAPKKSTLPAGNNVILMISEQNIEGPQRAWWASEIDLSATEAVVAQQMNQAGYNILEPSQLTNIIQKKPAFRLLDISDTESVQLGNLALAKYVIVGKAVASAGGRVPQSSMISCFANITAKVIRVKDGKVIAYLDASGSTVHMDPVTGGKEALSKAAEELAGKIINALKADSGA